MGLGRVVFILSSIVIAFLVNRFHEGGAFRTLQPHSEYASCKKVYGAPGPEDAVILDDGIALISGGDRRKWLVEGFDKQIPGCGIFKYDLNSDAPPTLIPIQGFSGSFHPHGIGMWKEDSEILLFAVNHGIASEGESVVIFKYENSTLFHVKTVFHTLFVSLNDVVPVGKNSFYVTNDHRQSRGFHLLQVAEDLFNLCLGNVVYYSDGFAQEVATRLGFANGVATDNYGRLYVAEATGYCVGIYQRDKSGSVRLIDKVKLHSGADNIDVVDHGNGDVTVYIASHPNALKFLIHSANKDAISPSQVFKIKVSKYNEVRVEEEYLGEGEELAGATVAAYWNHKRLLGSVFDDHFLVCNEK